MGSVERKTAVGAGAVRGAKKDLKKKKPIVGKVRSNGSGAPRGKGREKEGGTK